jgi:2-amino-4-hydroxy-6-hydroxymethyldihydropteridine diphosphokinase
MPTVFLGLGSNIAPRENLTGGLQALTDILGPLTCSSTYCSPAYGFDGPEFWNLVVRADTSLGLDDLARQLRALEYKFGRALDCTKFSSRHLDIDILLYAELTGVHHGIELPRADIFTRAFVLKPLAELAPGKVIPGQRMSAAQLWQQFDHAAQPLKQLPDDLLTGPKVLDFLQA